MIRSFPIVCLCIALLSFSCQKNDQLAAIERNPELAAQQFLNNTPSLILFGSLVLNHDERRVSGWVVDKYAQLRLVDMDGLDNLLDLSPANALESSKLYRQSSVIMDIDAQSLADNYKVALLQTPNATFKDTNMDMDQTSVIVSFQPISSTYSPALNECNNAETSSSDHMNGFQYNRKLWYASGRINQKTNLAQGLEMIEWINELTLIMEEE